MTVNPIIWLTDRSRTTLDWTCPRKRFWNYHAHGRGVVSPNTPLELFLGTALHDGLAAIATQHRANGVADIDAISTTAGRAVRETLDQVSGDDAQNPSFPQEQASLIEGLLRGFYISAWSNLIAQYPNIISIEEEMTYPLSDGIVFMSRPDLVLADGDGNWVYVEYKSTSSKNEGWVNQWGTAVQIHSTIRAIEHTLGTAPATVIVQGLYKGYVSYGRQNSPFCYAYYRQGTPPFSYPEWEYSYKSGFKKVPVWEMEGGLSAWLEKMPETLLADQFPTTPPIYIKDDLIDSFFSQRLTREMEIQMALQMMDGADSDMQRDIIDTTFPQRFDQCNPGWGKPCSYRHACFGPGGNLLDQGWIPRAAHHDLEVKQHAEQELPKGEEIRV